MIALAHPRASGRSHRPPVAIVGAGPGGLAAAMLLAASDVPGGVRVYEAAPTIGGRTSRITIGDTPDGPFHADRGPTFFLMPYVLDEIFRACGRRLADHAHLTRLDPMYRLVIGDPRGGAPVTLDATQDLDEMQRRLARLDPRDGPAFDAFIRDNRRKLDLMTPILRSSIRSPLDLARPGSGSLKFVPHLKPHRTVSADLHRRFHHPASRLALSFQSKYLGMSPYHCPSLFTILPFIEYEYGIWHPRGGCCALLDAMADICRDLGVEIRTSTPVERIAVDPRGSGGDRRGRRVMGVVARGEFFPHDHVVVNADATWALKHLLAPDDLARSGLRPFATHARIDAKRYSCSTFMLYLGLRGGVDLPHHTIYISATYRDNLDDITTTGRLSADPSIYVCNPSRTDPTLAPRGCSSLYVLMPTPSTKVGRSIEWAAERRRARQLCLDQLRRRLGVADLEDRILCEQTITPADWVAANINFGATFNLAHTLPQMLHRRVPHRAPALDGLWFVGGGTHPGSGLPVIWLSSQTTARLLCAHLNTPYAGDHPPRPTSTQTRAPSASSGAATPTPTP